MTDYKYIKTVSKDMSVNILSGISDITGGAPTIRFPSNSTHGVIMTLVTLDTNSPTDNRESVTNSINSGFDTFTSKVSSIVGDTGGSIISDVRSKVSNQLITAFTSKPKNVAYIILPMPNDVKVSYAAGWAGQSVTPIQYALRNIMNGQSTDDAGKLLTLGLVLETMKSLMGSIPNIVKGASIAGGVAFNPYKQLMYDSPSFRTFSFSWILSPKNADEADDINKLIWYLKRSMHPKTLGESAEESMIWMCPDFLDFKFILDGGTPGMANTWLPLLKRSAITNVSVNYETKFHGSSKGHSAGSPAATSLTIDLLETVLLTQSDFGSSSVPLSP